MASCAGGELGAAGHVRSIGAAGVHARRIVSDAERDAGLPVANRVDLPTGKYGCGSAFQGSAPRQFVDVTDHEAVPDIELRGPAVSLSAVGVEVIEAGAIPSAVSRGSAP